LDHLLERGLRAFETWLARSGSCPLSIRLYDSVIAPTRLTQFLQATLSHFGRLEHLELRLLPLRHTTEYQLPVLRSLALWRFQDIDVDPTPLTAFADAPNLRSVTLVNLFDSSQQIMLPWSQLTELVLLNTSSHAGAAILNQAVNLVHCTLHPTIHGEAQLSSISPLTRLESLKINASSTHMLPWLTLPALRSVEITHGGEVGCLDRLLACIARSGCSLQELHIVTDGSLTLDMCRAKFPSIPTILLDEEQYIEE